VNYVTVVAYGLSNDGKISLGSKKFVDKALKLIEQKKAKILCITGGNSMKDWNYRQVVLSDSENTTEAEATLGYVREVKGYRGKIIFENRSHNTYENFAYLLEEIQKQESDYGPIEMIIINHPEHLGRAICVAQAQSIIVWPVPIPVPWTNHSVPVFTRNKTTYKRRQFCACFHHLFYHLLHITGLKRTHPWM